MVDLNSIIRKARPSEEEENLLLKTADSILSSIRAICLEEKISAFPMLVGSVSKGTWLRGSDLDIFTVFGKEYSVREMESLGLHIGHRVLKEGKERYAEHPYVSGLYNGIKVDIVPCFRFDGASRIISSVDRTPLHTEFIRENLSADQKDQVRLMKLFLKHGGIYGSEVRVRGFSGYVCELLIYHFKTFLGVLDVFSSGGPRMVISKPETEVPESPVIIMDPTDHSRNASAAVSHESYLKFVALSKCYLANPSERYFEKQEKGVAKLKKGRGHVFLLTMNKPDLVDDIVYSQARRLEKAVHEASDSLGIRLLGTELECEGEISVLMEIQEAEMPGFRIHEGPPVYSPNAMEFVKKWKDHPSRLRGPYILGDRIVVDVANKETEISSVLLREIMRKNIGKNLNDLKDTIRIEKLKAGTESTILWSYYSRGICGSDSS